MLGPLLVSAALLTAPAADAAAGDSAPTAPSAEEMRQLIADNFRRLGADTLAERDAAEAQLLQLGPRVLDELPRPNDRMPEEVRSRLARIRLLLEKARNEVATDGSRVTLHLERVPLGEFFKQLQSASGNRIIDRRRASSKEADETVSLDVQGAPFWQALDRVLDVHGLSVDPFAVGGEEVSAAVAVVRPLAPRPPRAKLAHYAGPFRFEPLSITARRGLVDPADSGVQVAVEAMWEPRLTPISLSFPRDTITAVVDGGRNLKATRAGTEPLAVRGASVRFTVPLELPPRDVRRIERLTGSLHAVLPGYVETFRFERLAAGVKRRERKGAATVRLEEIRREGSQWIVEVRLRFDNAAGALQSHLAGWVEKNEVWLEGPDGKRIVPSDRVPTREGETEHGVAYTFPLAGNIDDQTLVYRTPAALVSRGFVFEFKDIELP